MVHKIIWALIVSQLLQGGNWAFSQESYSGARKLAFNWMTTEKVGSTDCIHLVEVFLGELRAIASDRVIELGTNENAPIELKCSGKETIDVRGKRNETLLSMRFQPLSQSFDSLDWVEFQKKFVNVPEITEQDLAPTALSGVMKNGENPAIESHSAMNAPDSSSSKPLFKKWWFWTLVGGAAVGIYAGVNALSSNRSMCVEIH